MLTTEITYRKGARKAIDIPKEVITLLNQGKIESVNLTQWLAIDHPALVKATFLELVISRKNTQLVLEAIAKQSKKSTMQTIKTIGSTLALIYTETKSKELLLNTLQKHPSDSIRYYAAYSIGLEEICIEKN